MFKASLKIKIISIITCIFVLIAFLAIYIQYNSQQKLQIKKFEENYASYLQARDQIIQSFRDIVWVHFRSIILKDRSLQAAIASKDEYEIEDNSVPGFNRLKVEVPELVALTFYLPDRKVLRREHSDKKGDVVDRPLIRKTIEKNKSFHGIERDDNKYLYFIAAPLTYRGKTIAYVEAGMNFDTIITKLKQFSNINDISIIFDKTDVPIKIVKTKESKNVLFHVPLKNFSGSQAGYIQLTKDISLEAEQAKKEIWLQVVFVLVLTIFIDGFFIIILTKGIFTPIQKMMEMMKQIDEGHLDNRLKMNRSDEIGQMAKSMDKFAHDLQMEVVAAFDKLSAGDFTFEAKGVIREGLKKTNESLNKLVVQINVAGDQIASGSDQISNSSQSLSQGTAEQASSLEEISSSMEEIGSQTKHSAENAAQANQLAVQTRDAAEKGNLQMQDMVKSMVEINDSGKNISKIIKVIDEIAFQTNLLALNAAVEAARAGKHGKGFAVVAEEVRNLAARSASAAKETAELIEGSVKKAKNGSDIANKTEEALKKIVSSVTRVTDLLGEIAAASKQQAQGIGQVNQSIRQIDSITQQNAANAEESAAASEELAAQANQMKEMLKSFKLKKEQGYTEREIDTGEAAMPLQQPAAAKSPVKSLEKKATAHHQKTKVVKPSDFVDLGDAEFGKY